MTSYSCLKACLSTAGTQTGLLASISHDVSVAKGAGWALRGYGVIISRFASDQLLGDAELWNFLGPFQVWGYPWRSTLNDISVQPKHQWITRRGGNPQSPLLQLSKKDWLKIWRSILAGSCCSLIPACWAILSHKAVCHMLLSGPAVMVSNECSAVRGLTP